MLTQSASASLVDLSAFQSKLKEIVNVGLVSTTMQSMWWEHAITDTKRATVNIYKLYYAPAALERDGII